MIIHPPEQSKSLFMELYKFAGTGDDRGLRNSPAGRRFLRDHKLDVRRNIPLAARIQHRAASK